MINYSIIIISKETGAESWAPGAWYETKEEALAAAAELEKNDNTITTFIDEWDMYEPPKRGRKPKNKENNAND